MGVFLTFALILSYIESLIPFYFGVPGMKLGLANLIVVLFLYLTSAKEALLLSILRVVLSGFLFGNMFSILYSLAGALLSFLVMFLAKKSQQFHTITISALGGISHNIGQLLVAACIAENYNILYYMPMLLFAGLMTGVVIGVLADELIKRLHFLFEKREE